MSLSLPPQASALRGLFDVMDLAELTSEADMRAKYPSFLDAKTKSCYALKEFSEIDSIISLCVRESGELWLVSFNRRIGWKRLWNFGDPGF